MKWHEDKYYGRDNIRKHIWNRHRSISGGNWWLHPGSEAGIKRAKEEKAPLSEIIDVLNERFGTEFEEADRLFFEQIEAELIKDETLQTQAKVNKPDTFKYAFEEMFIDKLIERMDQNQEIFEKILEDQSFGRLVKELMMKKVYARLNENAK